MQGNKLFVIKFLALFSQLFYLLSQCNERVCQIAGKDRLYLLLQRPPTVHSLHCHYIYLDINLNIHKFRNILNKTIIHLMFMK